MKLRFNKEPGFHKRVLPQYDDFATKEGVNLDVARVGGMAGLRCLSPESLAKVLKVLILKDRSLVVDSDLNEDYVQQGLVFPLEKAPRYDDSDSNEWITLDTTPCFSGDTEQKLDEVEMVGYNYLWRGSKDIKNDCTNSVNEITWVVKLEYERISQNKKALQLS